MRTKQCSDFGERKRMMFHFSYICFHPLSICSSSSCSRPINKYSNSTNTVPQIGGGSIDQASMHKTWIPVYHLSSANYDVPWRQLVWLEPREKSRRGRGALGLGVGVRSSACWAAPATRPTPACGCAHALPRSRHISLNGCKHGIRPSGKTWTSARSRWTYSVPPYKN